MIPLHGKVIPLKGQGVDIGVIKISRDPNAHPVLAADCAFISDGQSPASKFKIVIAQSNVNPKDINGGVDLQLPFELDHLSEGDVVSIRSDNRLRVLFRKKSHQNSILLTERCNHYCLMCSQPPKDVDDSYLLAETRELIKLIPQDTIEIGFTGGEPTLYYDEFIALMELVKNYLPSTAIHILSNGRAFNNIEFARKYAAIGHKDMMLGIPLYSDDPDQHNYIVQSENAFNETVKGILNLKSLNQLVEIRVVLHKQNISRLTKLCEFIARNLLFVDHVALMGLEIIGFTRANFDQLWIDPHDYKDTLSEAVHILTSYGMNVSVYNSQLCLVNADVLPYYRKSISDWKNEYAPECVGCTKLSECGGFFASGIQYGYSKHLKPFLS